MSNRPEFTEEQKDWICYQIGEWYLRMKPLLEGQHNLGYMKEVLKIMICDSREEQMEMIADIAAGLRDLPDDPCIFVPPNAADLVLGKKENGTDG